MNPIFSYLKIGLGLLASYLIVLLCSQVFFMGNSPLLRPRPDQYLAQTVQTQVGVLISTLTGTNKPITADDYRQFISTATANSLKQIAPGTYAATIKGENVQIINTGEIPQKEYSITLSDGSVQKVRVPVGQPPPTKAELDQVAKQFGLLNQSK